MRFLLASLSILFLAPACSSTLPVKQEAYAKLTDRRVFEYEFREVWKALESAMSAYSIRSKDADDGKLETDWIYGRSRDKYVSYTVNGLPRRQLLQTRVRYELTASKVMGGTVVIVGLAEEIEELRPDGSSAGWTEAKAPDTSRQKEILDKIQQAIRSAPNT